MRLLLDTCCIIWTISDPDALSETAKNMIEDENAGIYVSPISAAEIACASGRGRIVLDRDWKIWFRHYMTLNGWQIESISLEVIEEAYSLPGNFHPDPADRIITASARLGNYKLLTADRKILDYPYVDAVW